MKIFKSNLNELIAEIPPPGPLYLSNFSQTRDWGEMPMVTYQVTVAGHNAAGYVCELVIRTRIVWVHDIENRKICLKEADDSEREIKDRLRVLSYALRDGRISDDPVLGSID